MNVRKRTDCNVFTHIIILFYLPNSDETVARMNKLTIVNLKPKKHLK